MSAKHNCFSLAIVMVLLTGAAGCLSGARSDAPPVTNIDPQQATPDFWLAKPAVADISDADFYRLWNACRAEAHDRFFLIDRENYREGLLTTQPLISKQAIEFWRRDVVTPSDIANSTLATYRRTVRFELTRQADGTFTAHPKVLVERFASAERRLTAIYEYHTAFSGPWHLGMRRRMKAWRCPAIIGTPRGGIWHWRRTWLREWQRG